ncbi:MULTISPECIES: abortive infection system antitoxin AbiGi family protein [Enterobacteriaceae]|jgi:hypothetical protein|nr:MULTISPECIES: abortive infection system antitoxin AbiGi family protein [Enterobacteriaceae]EKX4007426.1 hypothetical protein [Enterobacter cloacae]AVB74108.1 hypothetical protein C3483_23425 [Klebsiella pneumoniae]ESL97548.1 hypothetical protein L417_04726 [Klebsiella pneumoniae UCICRE 6]EWD06183.1 hypothetical protein P845_04577 [Klebsiella pneumoniae UCI 42]KAB0311567.1 hypothetical protein FPQ48_19140 [Klebsiella pneumoniae]
MIIHFTNNFKKLTSIISSSSFLLRYCGEYFGDKRGAIVSRAAHPMVSFSEYEHNELHNKTVTYGGYGIALKKSWAVRNGLTPVNYIEKNSPVALGLIALLRSRQLGSLPKSLRLPVIQLKCFTKHVYGYNSHFKEDDFFFKYENEWRFVPTIQQIGGGRISVDYSKYKKRESLYNNRVASYPLKFLRENVKYIYVQSAFERQEIIDRFGFSERQVVISTWKQSIKSKNF